MSFGLKLGTIEVKTLCDLLEKSAGAFQNTEKLTMKVEVGIRYKFVVLS